MTPNTGEIDPNKLPEDTKALVRDLSGAIAAATGGIAGDSAASAQLGGVVGVNAVENNSLKLHQLKQLDNELQSCNRDQKCINEKMSKYIQLSDKQSNIDGVLKQSIVAEQNKQLNEAIPICNNNSTCIEHLAHQLQVARLQCESVSCVSDLGEKAKREIALKYGSATDIISKALEDFGWTMPWRSAAAKSQEEIRYIGRLLSSSNKPYKGNQTLTTGGRAITKHPEYFGFNSTDDLRKIYRTDKAINELSNKAVHEMLEDGVKTTGKSSRYPRGWVTYTLKDGRAASWHSSGEFIGFRGAE